jgi:hypothetical protein
VDWVSSAGINWTVMLALLVTKTPLHLGLFVTILAVNGVTLFRSYQELVRVGFSIVFKASSSVNFSIGFVTISQNELICGGLE